MEREEGASLLGGGGGRVKVRRERRDGGEEGRILSREDQTDKTNDAARARGHVSSGNTRWELMADKEIYEVQHTVRTRNL